MISVILEAYHDKEYTEQTDIGILCGRMIESEVFLTAAEAQEIVQGVTDKLDLQQRHEFIQKYKK